MALATAASIAQILAAAGAVYSATQSPPKQAGQTQTVPGQGAAAKPAESVFQANVPSPKSKPPSAVRANSDPFVANLIGPLLAGAAGATPGGATITPQQTQLPGALAPIDTATAIGQPSAPNRANPNIADILGSVPEALAIAGPLLGVGQKDRRVSTQAVGAQGGGAGGRLVEGLNLPRRQTLGELLSALPRPRYG